MVNRRLRLLFLSPRYLLPADTGARSAFWASFWGCSLGSLLPSIGISVAGLAAHLGGALVAWAFNIDELIPSAAIFFAAAALIGWIGNRFWPENWLYNPLL